MWEPEGVSCVIQGMNAVTKLTFQQADQTVEDQDRLLLTRAVAGDEQAFAALVNKYRNRIFNFAYRYCNDRQEAEDLTQEVFIKAYRNLAGFRGESKFSTWLFQITKNQAINRVRMLSRRMRFHMRSNVNSEGEDLIDRVASENPGQHELVQGREEQKVVQRAIQRLAPSFRVALILRDIEDLSYEEIGSILELPEGTVKSRIHRARSELKKLLIPYMEN